MPNDAPAIAAADRSRRVRLHDPWAAGGCPNEAVARPGRTMGRGRRARFDRRTHRQLDVDGDVLTWLRIRRDGRLPILEAFRLASRGALHPPVGLVLLAEHDHPDAVACVNSELTAVQSSLH